MFFPEIVQDDPQSPPVLSTSCPNRTGPMERKHGLSTEQVPASAYAGSSKNLKDLKDVTLPKQTWPVFDPSQLCRCQTLAWASTSPPRDGVGATALHRTEFSLQCKSHVPPRIPEQDVPGRCRWTSSSGTCLRGVADTNVVRYRLP